MSTTLATISGLTDEQRDFQAAIADFCQRELGTKEQRERITKNYTELHSQEIYEKLAELGWLGVSIDEAHGGSGGGMVDACIFLEGTMRGLVPIAGYGVSLIVAGAYERFGTDEQKEEILGGITPRQGGGDRDVRARGRVGRRQSVLPRRAPERRLRPQRPEDVDLRRAHRRPHPAWSPAPTTRGSKHEGLTMFSVPTDADGIEIRGIETMGGREVNDVFFTDCYVPDERVLGQVDGGWMQLMAGLNVERLILAASALGIAQRAFDDLLAYVKERKQFGRPIGSFQALKHRIADLATELECTRLLVYDVARKVDADPNQLLPREASMAKLKATEVAKKTALEGMQMMGGYGYATEYDMERHVRATLVMSIYGGTNEIQREIVSKTYGL